jgi:uncharacterized LabA/DUF88 family protein
MTGVAPRPRARIYIDGFNLYRRRLEGTANKWLDLVAFAQRLAPAYTVDRVRYFTALVLDPAARLRQRMYLRALATFPEIEIHDQGKFTSHTVVRPLAAAPAASMQAVLEWHQAGQWRPLKRPAPGFWVRASVEHVTEKGSDVALGTYLVADAFRQLMDAAFVVTGDSDLAAPIQVVSHELGLPVTVFNPSSGPSAALHAAATTYRNVRPAVLAACQLPDPVVTAAGQQIPKPPGW